MESLALLVGIILLTMFFASITALALTFVNRRWARITSIVCSIPALAIAVNLLLSVDSTGARIMGVGVSAAVFYTWYRNFKFLRSA